MAAWLALAGMDVDGEVGVEVEDGTFDVVTDVPALLGNDTLNPITCEIAD